MLANISFLINTALGWPLIIYVLCAGVICTLACRLIQLRYFLYAWKALIKPQHVVKKPADMTPVQAFLSTLSANLGNGSLAGMATAVYAGGPGAAIWVLIIGILLMAVRFSEVYLSIHFDSVTPVSKKGALGGPMLYLRSVRGGMLLAKMYTFFAFFFCLLIGNALQTNSISLSAYTTWKIPVWMSAFLLTLFMIYVVLGGSRRVARLSERIVPLKVIVFFGSSLMVLFYHYAQLIPALRLMIFSAFSPTALGGGVLGFSVQQAMRYGIQRSIYATESGLGTAAILFSGIGSSEATKNGIIAMLSTFISTLVCFLIAWCIVASGAWESGLTSTPLTIASYEPLFGWLAGWIITFLSISFGIGVLVSFVYITQEVWFSLTGGMYKNLFYGIFCVASFLGAMTDAATVFANGDIVLALMLLINLYGIVCLLPIVTKDLAVFETE